MIEELKVKDEALAKLKDELILKQKSLDDAVSGHLIELKELQKVTREQSQKILMLQNEVAEKEEELVITRKEISELHHELVAQQSDDLSAERACEQTLEDDLEGIIDTLQAYVEAESSDSNNLIQQLQIEHLFMKQELASYEKEMMEKLNVKELALAELREELLVKQNSLDVTSLELEECQKQSQEQSNEILTLQREVTEKEEELVVTRNKLSGLNDQLAKQFDLLSVERADNQKMQDIPADKEMADDNEINDAFDLLQQLKLEHLQELDNQKEMMEILRAKDKVLAELKEEMILKQNSFNAAVSKHSYELEEMQKITQEQSDKVSTLQKEVEEKEEELVVMRKEMSDLHHELTQQADHLSVEAVDKQTLKQELTDKEQIIDKLEADITMYKGELNDTKDLLSQVKKEMEENIRVKDEALVKLKDELLMKQNCLDDMNSTASRRSNKLDEWRRETQEQLVRISTLQKEAAVKEEKLVAIQISEISNLRHQLLQKSDLLSVTMRSYTNKEQTFQYVLADKQRIIEQLRADNEIYAAEMNNGKSFRQKSVLVKQESEKEMEEKIRDKDEELAKLKEELIKKQNSFDEWVKQSQEQSNKISTLQKEVAEKEEELVVTKKEMFGLKDQLTKQSDPSSAKKGTILTWRIVDELEADNVMYRTELNDTRKHFTTERLILEQQLADSRRAIRVKEKALADAGRLLVEQKKCIDDAMSRHSGELQKLQKVTQEQILTLQKSLAERDEEIDLTRREMFDLNDRFARQSDELNAEVEEKQAMRYELIDKDIAIDALRKAIAKYKKHPNELEEWQKESKEQSDKILALQQEVVEKGEELAASKSEMSNLYHQLVQQSDLLSATMTSYAEKEQAFQNVLADKERIIGNLQSDIEMYMAKLNDSKDLMQQLKLEHLSEIEELEKEMMEKVGVKDEALGKLKEQLIASQNILDATVNKHSIELKEWRKQNEEESNKISTLQKMVAETEEKLVATRNEMSDMNDELTQQSNLLSAEVAYTRSLKQSLADKERIIDQLKEDIATYQTEANNNKYHISELEKDYLSVKQELDDNKKEVAKEKQSIELQMKCQDQIKSLKQEVYKKNEELSAAKSKICDLNFRFKQRSDQMGEAIADKNRMIKKLQADIEVRLNDAKGLTSQLKVEMLPRGQTAEGRDGVLIMQSKGKDNTLSTQVKAVSDGEKEMLGARGQTAEGRDGVLIVRSKEKESSLPNQAKAVWQEVETKEERVITDTNKPGQRADNVYIIPDNSSKEVSHQKC